MPEFLHSSRFEVSAEDLFAWHGRPGAFERLAPPWRTIRIVEKSGTIRDGDRLVFAMRALGPIWIRWVAEMTGHEQGRQFQDVQRKGPFREWVHTHLFHPEGPAACTLEERIRYRLPAGMLGELLMGRGVRRDLMTTFDHRHRQTRLDVTRHQRFREHGPQRVAITGASGMIGSALSAFLTTGGHEVHPLVRRPPRRGSREIEWYPERGQVNVSALEGMDAVIHLAGASIAGQRWTPRYKAMIRNSRIDGTLTIAQALASLRRPPRVFLCASAVGLYGDRSEMLSDDSPPGDGFLADTAVAWEAACLPARRRGIPVTNMRFGVVLHPQGGALGEMLPPFKAGVGGRLGSGRQGMSWITLDDLIGAIHWLMFRDGLTGSVNLTAPEPVSNAEFTRTLGKVLRRPTVAPLPAVAVRTLFGEMGQALLLEGCLAKPDRLIESGFEFQTPGLESALRSLLGR